MSDKSKEHVPSWYFPVVSFPPPSTPVPRCNATQISYSGSFPYYRIFVLATSDAALSNLKNINTTFDTLPLQRNESGVFKWTVDPGIPLGTNITLAIRDGYGAWAFSESRMVVDNLAGANVTCPPNPYDWLQGSSSSTNGTSTSTSSTSMSSTPAHKPGWHLFGDMNTASSVFVLLFMVAGSAFLMLILLGCFCGKSEQKTKAKEVKKTSSVAGELEMSGRVHEV